MKNVLTILFSALSLNLYSQFTDMTALENDLVHRYKKIQEFAGSYDSTAVYSDEFTDSMNAYVNRYPQTLNHVFAKLKACGMMIATADNGNFRVYSWDTYSGGTMHFFRVIYQYKTATGVHCKIIEPGEGDPGYYCSQIFTLKAPDGAHYLTVSNGVYSTKDIAQWVNVYTIKNDSLSLPEIIFKNGNGATDFLTLNFDLFSVDNHPERPIKLIDYNPVTQTLTMPIVTDDGQVTNKTKQYHFDGSYFK